MSLLKKLGYLNPKNTLMLVCDVQDKFSFMKHFGDFAKNINKVVQAGKILDVPVIVTEHYPEKLGKTVKELDVNHAVGIFSKTKFSMIIPEIETEIKKFKDVDSIVLMGLESHICLEQTAMDLLSMKDKDLNVHVVADCALSRTPDDRKFALQRLREMGCIITSSENVIFKLMKDKNHPKFNDVRKLVNDPSVFPYPKL